MNKQTIRNYIIQNFLRRNYNIFIAISDSSIVLERDGICGRAVILTTTKSSVGRLILDLRNMKDRATLPYSSYTYIIGFEVVTKNIWLIPVDDIADNRTLLLGEGKKHYLLLSYDKTNEEPTISSKALQEGIAATIAKMNKKEINESNESKQKDRIDDILNTDFEK